MSRMVSPQRVSRRCMRAAWSDGVSDGVRRTLEDAHAVIEALMARCIATSKVLETVEAELAKKDYPLLDEDPGLGL